MRFVVDTSALVALINEEPEAERFHALLLEHEPCISCGTLVEILRVVQVTLGSDAVATVDRLLAVYAIEPVAVDAGQVALARNGMLGRGEEPAVLNDGDLFAYALAKQLRLPLLFKGTEFARTDVEPVP